MDGFADAAETSPPSEILCLSADEVLVLDLFQAIQRLGLRACRKGASRSAYRVLVVDTHALDRRGRVLLRRNGRQLPVVLIDDALDPARPALDPGLNITLTLQRPFSSDYLASHIQALLAR